MNKTLFKKFYVIICVIVFFAAVVYKIINPGISGLDYNHEYKTAFYIIGEAAAGETDLYSAFSQAADYAFGTFKGNNVQE